MKTIRTFFVALLTGLILSSCVGSINDSRWDLVGEQVRAEDFPWESTGKCYANSGGGEGLSYFTAVSERAYALNYFVQGGGTAVKGLMKDDYLLFSVPVEKLRAGTDVDFMLTMDPCGMDSPRDWIVEFYENNNWIAAGEAFRISRKDANFATVIRNFTISKNIVGEFLIRCRVYSDLNESGEHKGLEAFSDGVSLCSLALPTCRIITYPTKARDSKTILALGNSFTYCFGSTMMLKELARSQGHQLVIRTNTKGGQYCENHLVLEMSQDAINYGNFEYAFLQDQSCVHSNYYLDPVGRKPYLDNTIKLKERILEKSPECKVILENTWSYGINDYMKFGSYEAFDEALQKGCEMIAEESDCEISPIGPAFVAARERGINLYDNDNKHQNANGSYLKACVNYLLMYKTKFDKNASDCGLPRDIALQLREVAEEIVL